MRWGLSAGGQGASQGAEISVGEVSTGFQLSKEKLSHVVNEEPIIE